MLGYALGRPGMGPIEGERLHAMDGTDIALRIVGAFYIFAGLVAARAALTSNLIDHAISAIAMKRPDRIDTHRTVWLLGQSVVIFAGGVCLMLLLGPAAWIFVTGALMQALYFVALDPRYFDVADPPDPQGRQRSINAFVIYAAATLFVLWAAYTDRLMALGSASAVLLGSAAASIALFLAYIVRHTIFPVKRAPAFGGFDVGDDPADAIDDEPTLDHTGLPSSSKRLKVMADYGTSPLWAMDEGLAGEISPQDLGVSGDLTADLRAWANDFELSLNPDDPADSRWPDDRHKQHVAEGLALARRIKRELPDREVFVHDANGDLVEITADDSANR
jgi:hypothetical protein